MWVAPCAARLEVLGGWLHQSGSKSPPKLGPRGRISKEKLYLAFCAPIGEYQGLLFPLNFRSPRQPKTSRVRRSRTEEKKHAVDTIYPERFMSNPPVCAQFCAETGRPSVGAMSIAGLLRTPRLLPSEISKLLNFATQHVIMRIRQREFRAICVFLDYLILPNCDFSYFILGTAWKTNKAGHVPTTGTTLAPLSNPRNPARAGKDPEAPKTAPRTVLSSLRKVVYRHLICVIC